MFWRLKVNFVAIYQSSFDRVMAVNDHTESFFEDFYQNFITSSGEVARKFRNVDMERQKRVLKESLRHILSLFISTGENNYIKEIARVHNRDNLDIWPVLYDLWLESLIETVKKYDEKFDEDIELSWRMVMSVGITYMKFKYDDA